MPNLETKNSVDLRKNALIPLQEKLVARFDQATEEQRNSLPFVVLSDKTPEWKEATIDFKAGKLGRNVESIIVFRKPVIAKLGNTEKEMLIGITNKGDSLVFLSWNPFETNGNGAEEKSRGLAINTLKKDGLSRTFNLNFHNITHTNDAFARIHGAKDETVDNLLKDSLSY